MQQNMLVQHSSKHIQLLEGVLYLKKNNLVKLFEAAVNTENRFFQTYCSAHTCPVSFFDFLVLRTQCFPACLALVHLPAKTLQLFTFILKIIRLVRLIKKSDFYKYKSLALKKVPFLVMKRLLFNEKMSCFSNTPFFV